MWSRILKMDSILGKSSHRPKNYREKVPFFTIMGKYFKGTSRKVKKKAWVISNIQMVHFIWVISQIIVEMVVENSNGKMVRSMTVNGETIKNQEAEYGKVLMVYLTSANGKTTPSKALVCYFRREFVIKDNSRTI